jgi:hypothetical protein
VASGCGEASLSGQRFNQIEDLEEISDTKGRAVTGKGYAGLITKKICPAGANRNQSPFVIVIVEPMLVAPRSGANDLKLPATQRMKWVGVTKRPAQLVEPSSSVMLRLGRRYK